MCRGGKRQAALHDKCSVSAGPCASNDFLSNSRTAQNIANQQGDDEPIRVSDIENRAFLKGFRGSQVCCRCACVTVCEVRSRVLPSGRREMAHGMVRRSAFCRVPQADGIC